MCPLIRSPAPGNRLPSYSRIASGALRDFRSMRPPRPLELVDDIVLFGQRLDPSSGPDRVQLASPSTSLVPILRSLPARRIPGVSNRLCLAPRRRHHSLQERGGGGGGCFQL
ncbi:hypothetical protein LX36DRAFT_304320 [Colletotrichum falcatum]|nr:hypothetical protein LX36DRAFT_304320 [Colletotrichum falcatum]